MSKQAIHTSKAPTALGPYSQAIRAGYTVYLSGQIGIDPAERQSARRHRSADAAGLRQSARGRRSGRRFARRHRQADDTAGRPCRLRESERHHGELFQRAVSGARDLSGGGIAESGADRGRRRARAGAHRRADVAGRALADPGQSLTSSGQEKGGSERAPAGKHAAGQALAHRHRARAGSGAASAAALRGSDAPVPAVRAQARTGLAGRGRRRQHRDSISRRGASSSACSRTARDARRAARAAVFSFLPESAEGAGAGQARARVR